MKGHMEHLTERQRMVAFIAARIYSDVWIEGFQDADNPKLVEATVMLAGKLLDEVVRQNP